MIQALPMVRRLAALAVLLAPALAFGQDKPKETQKRDFKVVVDDSKSMSSDAKLAELEAKLQSLLKEIQALRSTPATAKTPTPHTVVRTRPAEASSKTDQAELQFWLETKDGKKVLGADYEKKPDAKVRTEKDGIVIIEGATGEKKVIGIEDLKKLKDDVKYKVVGEIKSAVADAAKKAEDVRVKVLVDALQSQLQDAKPAPAAKQPAPVQYRDVTKPMGEALHYYRTVTKATADGETISLSRTTYALPGAKAAALASFLKEVAQVKVLETKVEGDKLTVTTTPDVQSTIGQIVGLMTGKPATATFRMQFDTKSAAEKPAKP